MFHFHYISSFKTLSELATMDLTEKICFWRNFLSGTLEWNAKSFNRGLDNGGFRFGILVGRLLSLPFSGANCFSFLCLFVYLFVLFLFLFFFFLMRLWSNVLDSIIIFRQIWCVKKWLEGVNISFYTESLLNLISKYYLYLCRGPWEHNFFNAFILSHDKLSHFFSLPFASSLFFSLPFAFSLFSHLTVTPSASSLLFPQISIVKIYWLRCCYT